LSRVFSFRHVVMTFLFGRIPVPHLRCVECESLAVFRVGIFKSPADCIDRIPPLLPVQEKTTLIESVGRHFLVNRCFFQRRQPLLFDAEVGRRDGRSLDADRFARIRNAVGLSANPLFNEGH